jgi:drug/metabolite transporter (DMT)-like permease
VRLRVVLAMGLVYVVWGSTYLAIRVSVESIPPLLAAGLRFAIAGVLVAPLAVRERPSRGQVGAAGLLGVWLLGGGPGLLTIAEVHVPSNIAAVLASTTAITVCVWRWLAGERLARATLVGVAVGFAGVAILLWRGGGGAISTGWLVLALLSALMWSTASFYGRGLPLPGVWAATAIESLAAGILLTTAGLVEGERVGDISVRSGLAIAYLVLAGTATFAAYGWLLRHVPISTVVTHQYVNPVVALILGAVILGESLTTGAVVGAALVIGAVVAIVRAESAGSPDPELIE